MNDPQSVLRTVTRVIEAELKPEVVVILMRLNGWYSIKQPSHDLSCGPFKPHSAGAKVTAKLPDGINIEVTFEPNSDLNAEATTPNQEELK